MEKTKESLVQDEYYMRRAIALAKKGEGWCHPNPMVGAVIVKEGRIIGEGYHARRGELHAERNAIKNLTEPAAGAAIYVTLEPCCHYGRTPPCTEAILEQGITRVVIGSRDPNPKVAGKGAAILREAGLTVEEDFLKEECDALNPVFFHYITTKTPYVVMKYAMTMDGKIAAKTGDSKWITGEAARERVQEMRHACMGIMAGIGTVLADDPLLTCRIPGGRNPVRIICDSRLRIPEDSAIVKTARDVETILVCAMPELPRRERVTAYARNLADNPLAEKIQALESAGVRIWNLPRQEEGAGETEGPPGEAGVDLPALMRDLGEEEIDSVLLEGGGTLNESALRAGIVHEIRAFIAPKIFGGHAKSPVEGCGVEHPGEALLWTLSGMERIGEDLMLTYRRREEAEE